jgi:hypothetical protein
MSTDAGTAASIQYGPGGEVMRDLGNRFTYHAPKGDQTQRYEIIRERAHHYAHTLVTHAPASRELSLALTKLEEAVFWANAAIARNE